MAWRLSYLQTFDWDDTELSEAFAEGLILSPEGCESENSEGRKRNSNRNENEWKEGDFCRALYPYDGLMYEVQIVSINDDTCIVDFLGYGEELEVGVDSLMETRGKQPRRLQIYRASRSLNHGNYLNSTWKAGDFCRALYPYDGLMYEVKIVFINDDTCIVDFLGYDEELEVDVDSLMESRGRKARRNQIQRARKSLNHGNYLNSTMLPPGFPPMPQCSNLSQDPSLAAVMTSWYLAGYYTGLYQGQKNQRCCRHAPSNCRRH